MFSTDSIVVLSCLNGVVSEIAFAPCLCERRRWESGVKAEDSRFCYFALLFYLFIFDNKLCPNFHVPL